MDIVLKCTLTVSSPNGALDLEHAAKLLGMVPEIERQVSKAAGDAVFVVLNSEKWLMGTHIDGIEVIRD